MSEENSKIIQRAYESSGLRKGAFAKTLRVSPGHISDILNGNGKASDSLAEFAAIMYLEDGEVAKSGDRGRPPNADAYIEMLHVNLDIIMRSGTKQMKYDIVMAITDRVKELRPEETGPKNLERFKEAEEE